MAKKNIIKTLAVSIVLIFLISGFSVMVYGSPDSGYNEYIKYDHLTHSSKNYTILNLPDNQAFKNTMAKVSYPLKISNSKYLGKYTENITVIITFKLNNESALLDLLKNISTPGNTAYHKYITKAMFEKLYSPDPAIYDQSVNYFKNFGVKIQTYADRVSISLTGSSSIISRIFNVSFGVYIKGQNKFYSINQEPSVPNWMAPYISQISGMDNYYKPAINSESMHINTNKSKEQSFRNSNLIASEYPTPINSSGVQYIYGSDLQVAYDEQTLFNFTYPTKEVVATILWSGQYIGKNITTPYGTLTNGTLLGPFDPADIYAYYNDTLPAWEPHSKILAVPLDGAPRPGPIASYDTSGAVDENTLDLEMVGSTAPGSIIFNVYTPATNMNIDQELAFILNPNSSYLQLNNVSVISNSWGSSEYNDTAWYEYLQEAEARGITVLASSGDSGDNAKSSKYLGSNYANDWVEFPSAMAYDSFGVTAVGGTTLRLTSTLSIENQVAWYISQNDTENGGPAGSTGGISKVFKEPYWQYDSIANNVLNGTGRGVPDIAAIANNTIIYITVDGTSYYSGQYLMWGTSVASPVEAGIVAEINAVLSLNNQPSLGYLNPLLYRLANDQLQPLTNTNDTGYIATGTYNSSLPTLPFYNVDYGRNHIYDANYGYNFVTGWGSLDAYNFTMYILNVNYNGTYGTLDGVQNNLTLSGLSVTSYYSNGTLNTGYNASIQQNLFVANSLGAPIYWIQNVIYINGSQKSGWYMDYTGWVVYPFYGQYPGEGIYEYDFPNAKIVSLPHTFNIKTWISNVNNPMNQIMNFEINSQILQIPVPGASFIIGSLNYSYYWQGNWYYNGPYPDNPYPGGLAPQIGIVGGPSGGIGNFEYPTSGTMQSYLLPLGDSQYIKANTETFNESNDQTGETAQNLNWVYENGTWKFSVLNGSNIQGVVSSEPKRAYNVNFTESGLPLGTPWSVRFNNIVESTIMNYIIFNNISDGSYPFIVQDVGNYIATPSSGTIIVNGEDAIQFLNFSLNSSNDVYPYLYPVYNNYQQDLENNKSLISGLQYEAFQIESNGSLNYFGDSNVTSSLLNIGINAYPMIVNNYEISNVENLIYNVNNVQEKFINDAISFALNNGYSGYSIDFEPPSGSDFSQNDAYYFVQFLNNFSSALHQHNLKLFVAIDPAYNGVPNSELFYYIYHPYTKIYVDYVMVMAYEGYYSSDYPYNFIGAVQSILNAVGEYISINQIQIILSTINPNTNLPFNEIQMNERINYVEQNGIHGLGIWSMSEPGGFPKVENLWNLISNFESKTSNVSNSNNITFTESGLPSGTAWYVNITGDKSYASITDTITFSEPNGTYEYTIATIDKEYAPSQYTGTFTVNGASVSESVTFNLVTYTITFTENGLPAGTGWYLNLSNGQSFSSVSNIISFSEPNGTYEYTIETPISGGNDVRYITTESFGNITINSTNKNIYVNFTTQYYLNMEAEHAPVTDVYPSSGWHNKSSRIRIFFNNSPYLSQSGWIYFEFLSWNGSGNGSYTGTNSTVNITMNDPITEIADFARLYVVTFNETGLPPGTEWFVNLSNGISLTPPYENFPISDYYFSEFGQLILNGTYSYTVSTVNKDYYSADHGTFIINGSDLRINITFMPIEYPVSFTESGLAAGTEWSVTLNGTTESFTSDTLTFSETNGTYSYTIHGLAGYRANTYSGNITVNGNAVSNSIVWNIVTYPVIITQSGIPSGTTWSATLRGTAFNGENINITVSSANGTVIFNEPNGSYTYTVHLPSGYTSSNAKGYATVSGASTTATITAQSPANYLLYVIIAIVGIIIVLGVIMKMRRNNNKGHKS
ncbi:MAG: protease pro-enzyme activation domain-containing protein [Thermoplasmata archaeon]